MVIANILGFAGVAMATILGLFGVLHAARPPQHLADVEGLRSLIDELRTDRDDLRAQIINLQGDLRKLRDCVDKLQSRLRDRGLPGD